MSYFTPDAMTGWHKAFRIIDREHLKMRLNKLEPGCAQTLLTWDYQYNARLYLAQEVQTTDWLEIVSKSVVCSSPTLRTMSQDLFYGQ
jgi:hypothetical protein